MKEGRKFFLIMILLCFGGGVSFFGYMAFSEYQARNLLPAEMRNPDAIQKYFDGVVCLGCETAGFGVLFLAFILVIALIICWGIYEAIVARKGL